jgi:glycosyltransferase involved in cell wall biosynthesis
MQPFFSLIIPTLNEEKFVGGILDDLASQSFTSFDVIHVDGDSEDMTCAAVSSYTNRLTILSLKSDRRNLSYQRNLGADTARGQYLVFIDADTRIPDTHFLQIVYEHYGQSKREIYLPRTRYISSSPFSKLIERINNCVVRISQSTRRPLPTSGLAIFEREFFLKIGGYALSERQDNNMLFVEDQEIMLRAHTHGAKSEFVEETEYVFSLRRIEREGWHRVLPKILISTLELLLGKQIITQRYKMGGQRYRKQ